MKVPRSVRLQATHLSVFPSRATEIDRVWSENGPKELSKREFYELATYATEPRPGQEYPFLYVDTTAPVSRRFRRNYDEVLEIGGGGEAKEDVVGDDTETHTYGKAQKTKRAKAKKARTPY
jgi:hypothetical protein